ARGNASHYAYDALGRLLSAEDRAGGLTTLSRSEIRTNTETGYLVTLTSPLGRTTGYRVERLSTGDERQIVTLPSGLAGGLMSRHDGTRLARLPDETTVTLEIGPDPRWGMTAAVPRSLRVATPGGRTLMRTFERAAELTDPDDPLSLASLTEILTLAGRTYTSAFAAA